MGTNSLTPWLKLATDNWIIVLDALNNFGLQIEFCPLYKLIPYMQVCLSWSFNPQSQNWGFFFIRENLLIAPFTVYLFLYFSLLKKKSSIYLKIWVKEVILRLNMVIAWFVQQMAACLNVQWIWRGINCAVTSYHFVLWAFLMSF